MRKASLSLPANLVELEIAQLNEAISDLEAVAHSAMRQGNHKGPWTACWIFDDHAPITPSSFAARISAAASILGLNIPETTATIETIDPNTNWLEQSYQAFPPFTVGPFFIHGSHHTNPAPDGLMPLQIDAATAFGSGEHGTTKGCLQAMLDLKAAGICPWNILDMGTGSGILAIAAWKLWKTPIAAIDIDPESIIVTQRHAEKNGVKISPSSLSLEAGDGFNTPLCQKKKPYELVIANILAGPLIEMAPDLAQVMDENSYVILSGMLSEQSDKVIGYYEKQNLTPWKSYVNGEWSTIILKN